MGLTAALPRSREASREVAVVGFEVPAPIPAEDQARLEAWLAVRVKALPVRAAVTVVAPEGTEPASTEGSPPSPRNARER